MTFDTRAFVTSCLSTAKVILFTVIPYFLLAELLVYFEIMPLIAQFFTPFTTLLNLPPEAALALASGVFLNLYAAIAFAAPLGLSVYDWTILGLFLGVLHSIPVESAIMKKLGIDWIKSISFRLVMAFVVLIPLLVIPAEVLFDNPNKVANALYQVSSTTPTNFVDFLELKLYESILLSIEIILLVSLVILVVTLIKGLQILQKFDHHLGTIMALITGVLIGITYGAGVLLKEAKYMTKQQIASVCYFLMVAHAIIEDTLLFVFFGADIVLLISIRLFFATLVFLGLTLYYKTQST
ncbi:MAG: nucleoside recognition protein [Candidatus Thioglobus sp.]|nr:nucleoside recognition protein [Candidatus Thioglobus pontius]MBL6977237.1 nucleoside recognition protein [Candidatus Thioglobus sp.]MBL6985189.1 nucleoside recognition protein [Candidatus Thioglobus sp.]